MDIKLGLPNISSGDYWNTYANPFGHQLSLVGKVGWIALRVLFWSTGVGLGGELAIILACRWNKNTHVVKVDQTLSQNKQWDCYNYSLVGVPSDVSTRTQPVATSDTKKQTDSPPTTKKPQGFKKAPKYDLKRASTTYLEKPRKTSVKRRRINVPVISQQLKIPNDWVVALICHQSGVNQGELDPNFHQKLQELIRDN
jgi:hypothetical protein